MSYLDESRGLEVLDIGSLLRAAECPASWGSPASDSDNEWSPHLRRWIALREAIEAWHSSSSVEPLHDAESFAFVQLDKVQRDVCSEMLRTYIAMADRNHAIEFDPPVSEVFDEKAIYSLRSRPTAVVRHAGGETEFIKLRTGSAGTRPEEAAVLLEGADEPGIHADWLLSGDGDAKQIESEPATRRLTIDRLFEIRESLNRDVSTRRSEVRPGMVCFRGCRRAPYCGAYPVLEQRPPATRARAVIASKSAIALVADCERRAAWSIVHGIPAEPRSELDRGGFDRGLAVHELLSQIVLAEDAAAEAQRALNALPDFQAREIQPFIDNHLSIADEHEDDLEYRRAELHIGVTVSAEGRTQGGDNKVEPVTVVMIARVDAAGREADGTPAIVEHKTSERSVPYEADLYAASGWYGLKRFEELEAIAVHHHYLGRLSSPRCDRKLYRRADVDEAVQRLRAVASRIAAWDPADALKADPLVEVASACHFCDFKSRCSRFGGPPGLSDLLLS